jgi:hypothetical protein
LPTQSALLLPELLLRLSPALLMLQQVSNECTRVSGSTPISLRMSLWHRLGMELLPLSAKKTERV